MQHVSIHFVHSMRKKVLVGRRRSPMHFLQGTVVKRDPRATSQGVCLWGIEKTPRRGPSQSRDEPPPIDSKFYPIAKRPRKETGENSWFEKGNRQNTRLDLFRYSRGYNFIRPQLPTIKLQRIFELPIPMRNMWRIRLLVMSWGKNVSKSYMWRRDRIERTIDQEGLEAMPKMQDLHLSHLRVQADVLYVSRMWHRFRLGHSENPWQESST